MVSCSVPECSTAGPNNPGKYSFHRFRTTYRVQLKRFENTEEGIKAKINMVNSTKCVVVNCRNTNKNSDCKFYTFPKVWYKQEQRNKWIIAIRRTNPDGSLWHPKRNDRICSAHFIGGRKADEQASPSYVPRIFPANYKSRQTNENAALSRYQCYMNRRKNEIKAVTANKTNVVIDEQVLQESVVKEWCKENNLCATKDITGVDTDHAVKKELVLQEELVVKEEPREKDDSCATEDLASLNVGHEVKEGLGLQEEVQVKEEPSEEYVSFANRDQASHYTNNGKKEGLGLQEEVQVKEEPSEEYVSFANRDQAGHYTNNVEKGGLGLQEELLVKEEPWEEDERVTEDFTNLFADHNVKEELVLGPECFHKPGAPLGSVDGADLNTCGRQLATTSAHGSTSGQWTLPPTTTSSIPIENAKKPHACKTCDQEFDQYDKLMIHKLSHIGYNPYTCDICNKDFALLTHLETHKQFHTGERPYACDCGKAFTTPTNLKKHKAIHNTEKQYCCEVCKKQFLLPDGLKLHARMHSGYNPFSCKICKKEFTHHSGLKAHTLVHSAKKSYTCNICDKTFGNLHYFKRHERIHGDQTYSCDICCDVYTSIENLNMHKKFHIQQGPYFCKICKKNFRNWGYFKCHKQIHKGEKPCARNTCEIGHGATKGGVSEVLQTSSLDSRQPLAGGH